MYFRNHHEQALRVLREAHYLSARIDLTRFNRRLHALHTWLGFLATTLGELFQHGVSRRAILQKDRRQ